jgi:predicted HTH domain antitoxin
MDQKEFITAEEAAEMLSMTVNAFRIFVHRHGSKLKKVRLGKRKTYYLRASLVSLMQEF